MGIFDNIHIHKDVELEKIPDDWDYYGWQTKDLNPSLDEYMVRPIDISNWAVCSDIEGALFRRHPPIVKWTEHNEGFIHGNNVDIDNADHWRNIRYSGHIKMVKPKNEIILRVEKSVIKEVTVKYPR